MLDATPDVAAVTPSRLYAKLEPVSEMPQAETSGLATVSSDNSKKRGRNDP